MKMKNTDIMDLYQGLLSTTNLTGVKFSYAVARNIKKLDGVTESVQVASAPTKIFKKYEKERHAFAVKNAKKGKRGEAVVETIDGIRKFVMQDVKAFKEGFEVIREKHKKAIQERKKQLDDIKELLEVETEVDLFTISTSHIPEEITTKQMTAIMPIIKD